jgi:hypothetical protein
MNAILQTRGSINGKNSFRDTVARLQGHPSYGSNLMNVVHSGGILSRHYPQRIVVIKTKDKITSKEVEKKEVEVPAYTVQVIDIGHRAEVKKIEGQQDENGETRRPYRNSQSLIDEETVRFDLKMIKDHKVDVSSPKWMEALVMRNFGELFESNLERA